MDKTTIHVLPPGGAEEDVTRLIQSLLPTVQQSGGMFAVVSGIPGSSVVVAVLPSEEKLRIEQQDSRFKGKLIAMIEEKDARALGIIS